MLYYVQRGDTLSKIATKFNTSTEKIKEANVICNPNFLYQGQVLIIPKEDIILPKSQGQGPYYVVQPGDTLSCLSKEFNLPITTIAFVNRLANPNIIFAGSELLMGDYIMNPNNLKKLWEDTALSCDEITEEDIHNIYYKGSFIWESLGYSAIPYLLNLIQNPCKTVILYSMISLGRIAPSNSNVINVLLELAQSTDETISTLSRIVLRRIELARSNRRIHIILNNTRAYTEPSLESSSFILPESSEIMSLNWAIPSPTGEKNEAGEVLLYDRIFIFNTGTEEFIPRNKFNEINMI
ncbi:LysM domain-containing protein [Alkalithermobacter thermoalcaliphilus JW-YL-7 = DSM 7308]|uniref:LysM domain-containing protein n=1 Tax=Alkalithermobacter thermoalcaliphilus JW-YL-7 = DSM 7308 TaxID=1121328 RepID=A0A150FRS1_CLOPD|nr:Peptidoglycan-binding lysin domain-containing protein [[Clostridium] paradoxum JW-YL-7 = DSM 7308]SHK38807.1 LysM domain-containing protein [[Clostridium] paradoxum JW-YL-7 = DSM 7308]